MMDLTLSRRRLLQAAGAAGMVMAIPGRAAVAEEGRAPLRLAIEKGRIVVDGMESDALSIGGSVPGPVLRWTEGDEVTIEVENRLDEPSSIHWHGLLLAGVMDGAPGFNGYQAIPPGGFYTYQFRLIQSGTYWYHSHSGMQEQRGMYGAIVIAPKAPDKTKVDREHVVVLSDHTPEHPMRVLSHLKADPAWYNRGQRTLGDFIADITGDGLSAALKDRRDWAEMRMAPTDMADVTGYQFLINGRGPADNETLLFTPGQRVRLRIVNASAMSFFDVRIPGLPMTVIAADGRNVAPVRADEFRMGVGETYDVIVLPREEKAYTLMVEPIDRSGYGRATLAPRPGMAGEIPLLRPRAILSMADMGAMEGMDHSAHGAMTHGAMAGMDHGTMAGMDHSMHGAPKAPPSDGRPPVGWDQAGTLPGEKALSYADLRAAEPSPHEKIEPTREIVIRLTGQMERYIWTLNGHKFSHDQPIRVTEGERIRIKYINTTMMAHPMHLHGMFVELENGHTERRPFKHVTIVPPGRELSVLLTADAVGEWPFHCHLMFHMASGMMTRFIVEPKAGGTPA